MSGGLGCALLLELLQLQFKLRLLCPGAALIVLGLPPPLQLLPGPLLLKVGVAFARHGDGGDNWRLRAVSDVQDTSGAIPE